MNVLVALSIVVLAGAIGGVGHGLVISNGKVLPRPESKTVNVGTAAVPVNTTVSITPPSITGSLLLGALTGVVIFCAYTAPSVGITIKGTLPLTFHDVGIALIGGLGGDL
jgi:hypothetical protein